MAKNTAIAQTVRPDHRGTRQPHRAEQELYLSAERDLTSPSIATLVDILECLGTNLQDFFSEKQQEKVVFSPADMFEKVDEQQGWRITWLIPNAQKTGWSPSEITLQPGCSTEMDDPHEGEEFGYLLSGSASLYLGESVYRLRKGDTFCYTPSCVHGYQKHRQIRGPHPLGVHAAELLGG